MRLDRLVVEGFGPFAEAQEVDFRALDEAGLFLITGRTGSGKSSILDAICFALYGGAPRYEHAQQRLRSDHAGPDRPTRVELEFAIRGDRWRVARSPDYERPKRRGDGTTTAPATAALHRFEDGEWVGVAALPRTVAEHLGPLLQLTREQFLQVILLAQGRFQDFLRATTEDRQRLLRALFGTDRFDRFEAELAERAKALQQQVGADSAAFAADLDRLASLVDADRPSDTGLAWAEQVVDRLVAARAAAEEAADRAAAAFAAADLALTATTRTAELQRRRDDARADLERVAQREPEVAAVRDRLQNAVRALPVAPVLAEAQRATAAAAAAEAALDAAVAVAGEVDGDPAAALSALDEQLGALAGPLADEQRLPALQQRTSAAEEAHRAAQEALELALDEGALLPAQRERLREEREPLVELAAGRAAAEQALARARSSAAAFRRAAELDAGVQDAGLRVVSALDAEQTAVAHRAAVVAARLAGSAALLAARLTPGAPCPVCGAVEHPDPAPPPEGAPVPDEAEAELAERRHADAAAARRAAESELASLRAELAAARAESGGADPQQTVHAVADAEAAVRDAIGAAAEVLRIDGALAGLDERERSAAEQVATARLSVEECSAAAVRAASESAAVGLRIAQARGDAGSVAERRRAVAGRRAVLAALGEARAEAARAGAALDGASARLTAALDESGFADPAAARAAATTAEQRDELQGRIDAHEQRRAGAMAQLTDAQVAAAPEEPVDLASATRDRLDALAERDAAADGMAGSRRRARDGDGILGMLRRRDAATEAARADLAVVGPLAAVVRGEGANERRMRLESYVLAARLEQIVDAANSRLAVMTDGRFTLQHDASVGYRNVRSGLGLAVLDEHTGSARPTASLSGGETFLASLALALGLAEVVSAEAGGVRLDTLFVDEGFGSLDRETLDTAMRTLDSLRAGGRVVGLISHVEAMQEDIPAGLHVERTADGSSRIRLRAPMLAG